MTYSIEEHIREVVGQLYVKDSAIFEKEKDVTEDIRNRLRNITRQDFSSIELLLTNWIYRKYYGRLNEDFKNDNIDLSTLSREEMTGQRGIHHENSFWKYSKDRLIGSPDYNIVLRRGKDTRWVKRGEFLEYGVDIDDEKPILKISSPAYYTEIEKGNESYNWIYGKHLMDDDLKGIIRFYFNLKPEKDKLIKVANTIQDRFDLFEIPFQFKYVNDATKYGRVDTALIYTNQRFFHTAIYLVKDVYRLCTECMRDENPLFSFRLGPGLSFAENPENGDSFGMNRSAIIAKFLCSEKGAKDVEESKARLDLIEDYWESIGYNNVNDFYKNISSCFDYNFKPFIKSLKKQDITTIYTIDKVLPDLTKRTLRIVRQDELQLFGEPGTFRIKYLIAAIRIAIHICREAITIQEANGFKCHWLCFQPDGDENQKVVYKLLDNTLENGRAGVSLFLYKVCKYFDDPIIKRVAIRAKVDKILTSSSLGMSNAFSMIDELMFPRKSRTKDTIQFDSLSSLKLITKSMAVKYALELPISDSGISIKDAEEIADKIIERYIEAGRPLCNIRLKSQEGKTDYFDVSLGNGLAQVGYFFLWVYDPYLKPPKN